VHFDFIDVLNKWTDDSTFDPVTEQCIRGMACNEYEQVCEYLHCGIILWALVIFRPHRMHGVQLRCGLLQSYYRCSVVCVCPTENHAKTSDSIEIPFELWT